nr:unnamed protein product [Callosobruchus chinensis]
MPLPRLLPRPSSSRTVRRRVAQACSAAVPAEAPPAFAFPSASLLSPLRYGGVPERAGAVYTAGSALARGHARRLSSPRRVLVRVSRRRRSKRRCWGRAVRWPYREGSYRTRHTYLTRYGTEENIYEEISDLTKARRRAAQQKQQQSHYHHAHQESIMSLHQSLVEEEVRRVQSGHMRVLGELNLSVEAMLMPSNSREGSDDTDRENEDQLADLLTVGPTDELLSPVPLGGDLDSGFSGSSSSASYRSAAGSLRRGPDRPRSSCGTASGGGAACKMHASEGGGSHTKGFWGKKAWKKIASFPSNISLNKTKETSICLDVFPKLC